MAGHVKFLICSSVLFFLISETISVFTSEAENFDGTKNNPLDLMTSENVCGCDQEKVTVKSKTYFVHSTLSDREYGKVCSITDSDTNEKRAMKTFNDEYKFFFELRAYLFLNQSAYVPKLYSWSTEKRCKVMITEFVEDNLIGKPYSGIRQKWTNMLTAVNDVHHRANCSSECVGGRHAPDQTVIPGRRIYIYVPINLNFKGILHLDIHLNNFVHVSKNHAKILDFSTSFPLNQTKHGTPLALVGFQTRVTAPEVLIRRRIDGLLLTIQNRNRKLQLHALSQNWVTIQSLLDLQKANLIEVFKLQLLLNNQKVGPPADVWSACCTLYKMMYGETPYEYLLKYNKTVSDMVPQVEEILIIEEMILAPTVKLLFPAHEDSVLRDTVQQCLKRDPNERPTIEELLKKLDTQSISKLRVNSEL